jgi:type VI secretion system protein ImpJ
MQNVLWTKGVLLNPQHLQTQDRYLEDKLGFHVSSLAFCPWGFVDLEMDAEAVAADEVRLSRAAGLFADGLVFDIPRADVAPAPRSLEGHWQPDQTAMTVHLAIPEFRSGGRNVSARRDDAGTRFSPEVLAVRDENTGRGEKEILVARKNFRLLFEDEAAEGSTTMPVARIVRTPGGPPRLDPTFVPEILDISVSDHVLGIARRLVEILSARSAELGGIRRQRGKNLAEFGRLDVAHFWLLYTINSYLPLFRHLQAERPAPEGAAGMPRARRAHPAELYRTMAELAATLMTFSPARHPRDLPPYDHSDLSGCLSALDAMLRELLDTAIPTNCVTLRLEEKDHSIYVTSLDDDRQLTAVQAYLAVTSEMDQSRLIQKAPDWIKVASRDQIRDLLNRALPGVALRHQPSPPSAVPLKMGCQYFHLETSGPLWSGVLQSRSLAAWVPSDVLRPEIELVLLLPPGKG